MPGFDNNTVYADNVDFRGVVPVVPQITTDGQLLIGSTATPHIKVGTLTSTGGSVTITPGSGTINLEATGAGSNIQTINGDIGSITGNAVTIFANQAAGNAGSTVLFANSGTTSTFNVTDARDNTIIGLNAGNGTATIAASNTALGSSALNVISNGQSNCCIGHRSGLALTLGGNNLILGASAGLSLVSGDVNIIIGSSTGQSYTSNESRNIIIGNSGTVGESNTMRLGIDDAVLGVSRCFIAGISGVTTAQPGVVTLNTATGQLANVAAGTSGNVLTSNGTNWTSAAPATSGTVTSVSGTTNRITSTGGTTPVIDISASYVGQTSITTLGTISTGTWNGTVIDLAHGGTNANLTASNGGIFYSTSTAGAILAGTATAGQIIRSGASAAPSWSTSTYPTTNAVNTLLYASSANVMAALATANSGVLTTSSSGVPSIDTTNFAVLTTGVQIKGNNTNTAPPAGFIGQRIESTATNVAMTSTVGKTITSVSLTAGIWDVSGIAAISATGGTVLAQAFVLCISPTDNTLTGNLGIDTFQLNTVGGVLSGAVPALRITLSATTTYYLVGTAFYTSTTAPANGRLSATRVG